MRFYNRERSERNPKVLLWLIILKIIPGVTCCGNVPIGKMVQGFVRGHGLSLRHRQEAFISCPWEYCLRNTKRLLMASGSRKVCSVGKATRWRLRGDSRNGDDKQSKQWAGEKQNWQQTGNNPLGDLQPAASALPSPTDEQMLYLLACFPSNFVSSKAQALTGWKHLYVFFFLRQWMCMNSCL